MVEELLFIRGGKFVVFLINREAVIHSRIAKASENIFIRLTFYSNSINYCKQSSPSQCEVLRQISLPCVSTPADIFLVFCTLLNCLKCIIYEDRYNNVFFADKN